MADRLNAYDDLAFIGSITSQNGQSTLEMQGDGNLVLYRSGGKSPWSTKTDGKTVSQAVMQGDGNFVMYGPGGVVIWATGTVGHPGAWLIVQDDGNVVIYDAAGNPLWATNTNIIRAIVAGFLPSTSGFHFSNNSWPEVPDITINVLGNQIKIGDASKGLCGGMAFAARDYFEAGIPIPSDTTNPSSGPLFDYIVRRLFESFNLYLPPPPLPPPFFTPTPPFGPGPLTYIHLMNPNLPDHETLASQMLLAPHGRAWVMIHDEWPKIKADIDSGRLSPIALVKVKSLDPMQIGNNHQVLVYGYELDGTDLVIRLYDPNYPDDDSVNLSLSIADPRITTSVTSSPASQVLCFFQPHYTFFPPSLMVVWQPRGHANNVVGMAAINGKLFAATNDNRLWWRDPVGQDVGWEDIGHANKVVGMAAINGKLFAATNDNRLWWRDPVQNVDWEHIGHANNVVGMAAINGKLFAATNDNRLWWRDPVGQDVGWEDIGYANNVVGMAAINGKLFAATKDNLLYWRDPIQNVDWEHIGHANKVVGMAAINGKLFAATKDNLLWSRDPIR